MQLQQGIVQVDEQGNEHPPAPDTAWMVFLYAGNPDLQWREARMGSRLFSVEARHLGASTYEAGFDKTSGDPVVFKAPAGCVLFQLLLQPVADRLPGGSPRGGDSVLYLQLLYRGKTSWYKAGVPAEMAGFPAQ
ncbi:MAG TPA: hypothetical protein PKE07_06475 [Lacibacter sp.]|nr:hypothetical protein [Lacibacter sp.]